MKKEFSPGASDLLSELRKPKTYYEFLKQTVGEYEADVNFSDLLRIGTIEIKFYPNTSIESLVNRDIDYDLYVKTFEFFLGLRDSFSEYVDGLIKEAGISSELNYHANSSYLFSPRMNFYECYLRRLLPEEFMDPEYKSSLNVLVKENEDLIPDLISTFGLSILNTVAVRHSIKRWIAEEKDKARLTKVISALVDYKKKQTGPLAKGRPSEAMFNKLPKDFLKQLQKLIYQDLGRLRKHRKKKYLNIRGGDLLLVRMIFSNTRESAEYRRASLWDYMASDNYLMKCFKNNISRYRLAIKIIAKYYKVSDEKVRAKIYRRSSPSKSDI